MKRDSQNLKENVKWSTSKNLFILNQNIQERLPINCLFIQSSKNSFIAVIRIIGGVLIVLHGLVHLKFNLYISFL